MADQEMVERVAGHEEIDGEPGKYEGAVDKVVDTMTDVLGGALGMESEPFEQPGYGYEDDADYGDGMLDDDLYGDDAVTTDSYPDDTENYDDSPDVATSTLGSNLASPTEEAPEKYEAESRDGDTYEPDDSVKDDPYANDRAEADGSYDNTTDDYVEEATPKSDYTDGSGEAPTDEYEGDDYYTDDEDQQTNDYDPIDSHDGAEVRQANYDPYADEVEAIDPIETETNSYGYDDEDDYGDEPSMDHLKPTEEATHDSDIKPDDAYEEKSAHDYNEKPDDDYEKPEDDYEEKSADAEYGMGTHDESMDEAMAASDYGTGYDEATAATGEPYPADTQSTEMAEEIAYEEPAYEEPAYEEPAYEEPMEEAAYVEPTYEEAAPEMDDTMDDGVDDMMVDG